MNDDITQKDDPITAATPGAKLAAATTPTEKHETKSVVSVRSHRLIDELLASSDFL
jgi:hypothetical protein